MCDWVTLPNVTNVASFLGNIGNFALGVAACVGLYSFNTWLKQRRLEKKSEWAESALITFEAFLEQIDDWFRFIDYDEVPSYSQKFYSIQKELFIKSKNRASWLGNKEIDKLFEDLEKLTKPAVGNLRRYREHSKFDSDTRSEALEYLNKTPQEIKIIGANISMILNEIQRMEHKEIRDQEIKV